MTVTEEEAKEMLCPRPVAGAICVASKCMLWEFTHNIVGYEPPVDGVSYQIPIFGKVDTGYCNLGIKR